jgi:hypothetical protein
LLEHLCSASCSQLMENCIPDDSTWKVMSLETWHPE